MDETIGPWIFGSVHFRYKNSRTCGSCGKILIFEFKNLIFVLKTNFEQFHKLCKLAYVYLIHMRMRKCLYNYKKALLAVQLI